MDLSGAEWRKSSRSGSNGGACVEVAALAEARSGADRVIAVRDSKDPSGPVLSFTPQEWQTFTAALRTSRIDLG